MLPFHFSTKPWPKHAFRFGGGGGTGVGTSPIAAASPPVTASSAEVVQAQQDARRQALRKQGFSKTTFAGADGGWYGGPTVASPVMPKAAPAGNAQGARTLGGF